MMLPPPPRRVHPSFTLRTLGVGAGIFAAGVFLPLLAWLSHLPLLSTGLILSYMAITFFDRYQSAQRGIEVLLPPPAHSRDLLFVDEWETRALAIRDRKIIFLRNDAYPLVLDENAQRNLREQLSRMRELQQLLTNPYTC
jgi:hypothetical protein